MNGELRHFHIRFAWNWAVNSMRWSATFLGTQAWPSGINWRIFEHIFLPPTSSWGVLRRNFNCRQSKSFYLRNIIVPASWVDWLTLHYSLFHFYFWIRNNALRRILKRFQSVRYWDFFIQVDWTNIIKTFLRMMREPWLRHRWWQILKSRQRLSMSLVSIL